MTVSQVQHTQVEPIGVADPRTGRRLWRFRVFAPDERDLFCLVFASDSYESMTSALAGLHAWQDAQREA